MGVLLAALPILLILGLMVGLRWSAAAAGLLGLGASLTVAWLAFGYGTRTLATYGAAGAAGGALLEAVFVALTILWIVFPALCIHELQLRTGAVATLQSAMARLSSDPRIVALIVAWFFVLFVEGAAGFGTSVALAAPFLVSAGFGRVEAVTIALVGHAVGVSFGAVGTPIIPQVAVTAFTGRELAAATAPFHAVAGWMMPLAVMAMVARALPSDRRIGRAVWGWTVLAAACFLVPYVAIATFVGPELPTLGGALLGGGVFVAALVLARRRRPLGLGVAPEPPLSAVGFLRAAAPYAALVALVLVTRLVPQLRDPLGAATLEWSLAPFGGSVAPLYHPGTMLALAFGLGALWQRAPQGDVRSALRRALGQLGPVSIALVAMLGLSRVMVYAGMIDTLAGATALAAGGLWPLFAPFVGALGTFVTGSATASNILFTDFQQVTAQRLGIPTLGMLGAQGFGAAVGNIVCPHNIIAAGATVGLAGAEGEVLRRTIGVAVAYAFVGGMVGLALFR